MPSPMPLETCRALTLLARQLLKDSEKQAHTLVLAKGRLYRMKVSLEMVPDDQLRDVINQYR